MGGFAIGGLLNAAAPSLMWSGVIIAVDVEVRFIAALAGKGEAERKGLESKRVPLDSIAVCLC